MQPPSEGQKKKMHLYTVRGSVHVCVHMFPPERAPTITIVHLFPPENFRGFLHVALLEEKSPQRVTGGDHPSPRLVVMKGLIEPARNIF